MSDLADLIQGLRDEYDSKPEWFKAIAGSLPVTGLLAALHEYDKAVSEGKSEEAIAAAIGGLPAVKMLKSGSAVLSKSPAVIKSAREAMDSNILARALSNIGFGVGAGQSVGNTLQEAQQAAAKYEQEQAFRQGFANARGGEEL